MTTWTTHAYCEWREFHQDMASSSEATSEQQLRETRDATEGTLEHTGQPPETEGQTPELRKEAADDPAVLLRTCFDIVDTTPLAKHRGDTALPRTFEDLHKNFKKMLGMIFAIRMGVSLVQMSLRLPPGNSHYF